MALDNHHPVGTFCNPTEREGEMRYSSLGCLCVPDCLCAVTKMDQRDTVFQWHTADFHPRCCFDYFGQYPTIFREHCFTKAFSSVQI